MEIKNLIYQQFSRIGKAVSSPKRIELLDILCQGERTVELLANETKMTMGNTSQHLQVLREAKLVESEKKGMFVIYRIADKDVYNFIQSMQKLAENRLLEIDNIKQQFLKQNRNFEPIDYKDLENRILNKSVVLIDVRPTEEFKTAHIKGAISLPLSDLEENVINLPKDKEIVAYCRGSYCVLAMQAVEILRKKGFSAIRLEFSVQEWEKNNLPVVVGKS